MSINRTNLGSYTENGQSYPGYVSINLESGDEYVTFIVRSPPTGGVACGTTSSITIPVEMFSELLKNVNGIYARLCNPELSK